MPAKWIYRVQLFKEFTLKHEKKSLSLWLMGRYFLLRVENINFVMELQRAAEAASAGGTGAAEIQEKINLE